MLVFSLHASGAGPWSTDGRAEPTPDSTVLSAGGPSGPVSEYLPRVHAPKGRFFRTADGRVIMLRGVAVAARESSTFRGMGFDERSAALLKKQGTNVVRLGVVWANLEPRPGRYANRYIRSVARTVQMLARHGIYSIICRCRVKTRPVLPAEI